MRAVGWVILTGALLLSGATAQDRENPLRRDGALEDEIEELLLEISFLENQTGAREHGQEHRLKEIVEAQRALRPDLCVVLERLGGSEVFFQIRHENRAKLILQSAANYVIDNGPDDGKVHSLDRRGVDLLLRKLWRFEGILGERFEGRDFTRLREGQW